MEMYNREYIGRYAPNGISAATNLCLKDNGRIFFKICFSFMMVQNIRNCDGYKLYKMTYKTMIFIQNE